MKRLCILSAGVLLLTHAVFAQQRIVPPPHRFYSPTPQRSAARLDVEIVDQTAKVTLRQSFRNDSRQTLEGVFLLPLPKGAAVSDFSMTADGKQLKGVVMKKEEARRMYEAIVRSQRDPALLEMAGQQLFKVSLFPIPPGGEREIILKYSALLPRDGDLVQFTQALAGAVVHRDYTPFRAKKRDTLSVVLNVRISSKDPLKAIYSPSHQVQVHREGRHAASIGFEGRIAASAPPFVLYHSVHSGPFAMNLMTYDPGNGEEGYFMLLLSPGAKPKSMQSMPKDLLFVMDVSGSMAGEKLDQAKAALRYCLNRLGKDDRFNLITFATDVDCFSPSWVRGRASRRAALEAVNSLEAGGSTHIEAALSNALKLAIGGSRPTAVVFLTDGLPTVGERDGGKILKQVRAGLEDNVRLFTFGVGYDVNTFLLDQVAASSRAVSDYIEPGESLEARLATFYDRIREPALIALEMDWGRMHVKKVLPGALPDLYYGSQLSIMGRYRARGRVSLKCTGRAGGRRKTVVHETEILPSSTMDFLPQLWATRRIGMLIDELRLNGASKELEAEIVSLSERYGIISPLTSFLVQEESADRRRKGRPGVLPVPLGQKMMNRAGQATAPTFSGKAAVRASREGRAMKEAEAVTPRANTRRIGSSVFIRRDSCWTDTRYLSQPTVDIAYGSAAYTVFALAFPELARVLALGECIVFEWKGRFVRIGKTGREKWQAGECDRLFR